MHIDIISHKYNTYNANLNVATYINGIATHMMK